MRLVIVVLTVAAIVELCVTQTTAAPIYLEVDGIQGEGGGGSTIYKDWIDVAKFEMGVSRSTTTTKSGTARQRSSASFEDLVVTTTQVSIASPRMWEALAAGRVASLTKLTVLKSFSHGDKPIIEFELRNTRFTDYFIFTDDNGLVAETVAFSFEEILYRYLSYDDSGDLKGTVEATWRVEDGEALSVPSFSFTASDSPATIPEPSTLTLAALALIGLVAFGWPRRRA